MTTQRMYDATAIRTAAQGRWRQIFESLGYSGECLTGAHSRCPGICVGDGGGKDRFQFDDKDGSGSWLCYQGGAGLVSGDGISALMHFQGIGFREACTILGELLLGERGEFAGKRASLGAGVAPEPKAEKGPKVELNLDAMRAKYREEFGLPGWWERKSPAPIKVDPAGFLDAIFQPGDRIVICTRYKSPGDFMHWVGRGTFRLGRRPGIQAVPSAMPTGSPEGVWFMAQPVSGEWVPKPSKPNELTRRSGRTVTAWRYMVLECDAPSHWSYEQKQELSRLWLSVLAQLPFPIAALYTSGGFSVHCLVRLDGISIKGEFDELRRVICAYLVPYGVDPNAVTAVRLTRLPGCYRGDRPQRLLYLNPSPDPWSPPVCQGGNVIWKGQ